MAFTSSTAHTYWVYKQCTGIDMGTNEHEYGELDHYGAPTGYLYCRYHGEVVGYIRRAT